MDEETVLPAAEPAEASGTPEQTAAPEAEQTAEQPTEKVEEKPAKTPEQREIERARRKIDRLVRQREELRAQLAQGLTKPPIEDNNRADDGDSDQLTLSRAKLQEIIQAEAVKLAPKVSEQRSVIEHRQKVIDSLAKTWGQEKFDAIATDLDEALGGLRDQNGRPKPAADAIFESDEPAALIEYLADPEHADEAESLNYMTPIQLGRAMARIEAKAKAAKAAAKPEPSKLPKPIEPVRGSSPSSNRLLDLDGDDFDRRRREMIKNRR